MSKKSDLHDTLENEVEEATRQLQKIWDEIYFNYDPWEFDVRQKEWGNYEHDFSCPKESFRNLRDLLNKIIEG